MIVFVKMSPLVISFIIVLCFTGHVTYADDLTKLYTTPALTQFTLPTSPPIITTVISQPDTQLLNKTTPLVKNSDTNGTQLKDDSKSAFHPLTDPDNATLMRAFYVLLGVTAIVIVYFVIRAWRTKKKSKSSSRKYGLLNTRDDRMEMRRLEEDVDEEDDNMLFDRTRDHR